MPGSAAGQAKIRAPNAQLTALRVASFPQKLYHYIVTTGEEHSLRQFVAETFRQLGLDWRKHVVSDRKLFRPSDIE